MCKRGCLCKGGGGAAKGAVRKGLWERGCGNEAVGSGLWEQGCVSTRRKGSSCGNGGAWERGCVSTRRKGSGLGPFLSSGRRRTTMGSAAQNTIQNQYVPRAH
eukprot:1334877-Amorphochlora_amoeboformis.AAC.1